MSGRPSAIVTSEPQAAYETAKMKSKGLMAHSTPEKAIIVKLLLSSIRTKESVVTVNARISSAIRWSGLASSPYASKR